MDPESLWCKLETAVDEDAARRLLTEFVKENQSNFSVGGSVAVKEKLCHHIIQHCKADRPDSAIWSHDTTTVALTTLRILSRDTSGCGQLCCQDGLAFLATLANFNKPNSTSTPDTKARVVVEAVKCLCNIVLKNQHLAPSCAEVGILEGLALRLPVIAALPHLQEMTFFDLRLLFLLTAVSSEQRSQFRERCRGLETMLCVMDAILFGSPSCVPSSSSLQLSAADGDTAAATNGGLVDREGVVTVPRPLEESQINSLSEVLKIVFNQTVQFSDKPQSTDEEDLKLIVTLVHLVRVTLTSVPAQLSSCSVTLIGHCAEVLVNIPLKAIHCLLLPSSHEATHTLKQWYPSLYSEEVKGASGPALGGVASGVGVVHTLEIDQCYDKFNMAAVLCLLNYLSLNLSGEGKKNVLPPILTALRQISLGHRSVRRFLKSTILPQMYQVTQRPDEGHSLKSKLVRLMLPGTHGAEQVVSEFLFVLCKEDASRLVKHTGYGNAAGLLMAHGLLGGGRGEGAGQYSSDSEDSDTEEYLESRAKLDPVTGGLSKDGPSPLDGMTEEEKEQEAEKLHSLMQKLNAQGIFKMLPVGEDNKPLFEDDNQDA